MTKRTSNFSDEQYLNASPSFACCSSAQLKADCWNIWFDNLQILTVVKSKFLENYPKLSSALSLGWERDNCIGLFHFHLPLIQWEVYTLECEFSHPRQRRTLSQYQLVKSNQMMTECGNIVCQARPPSPAGCHSRDMRPESQFPTKTATFPLCAILYYYVLDAAETLDKKSKLLLWYFSIKDLNANLSTHTKVPHIYLL